MKTRRVNTILISSQRNMPYGGENLHRTVKAVVGFIIMSLLAWLVVDAGLLGAKGSVGYVLGVIFCFCLAYASGSILPESDS